MQKTLVLGRGLIQFVLSIALAISLYDFYFQTEPFCVANLCQQIAFGKLP